MTSVIRKNSLFKFEGNEFCKQISAILNWMTFFKVYCNYIQYLLGIYWHDGETVNLDVNFFNRLWRMTSNITLTFAKLAWTDCKSLWVLLLDDITPSKTPWFTATFLLSILTWNIVVLLSLINLISICSLNPNQSSNLIFLHFKDGSFLWQATCLPCL